MGGTRRDAIYERMLADSLAASPSMQAVPTYGTAQPIDVATSAQLQKSIDNAVLNADGSATVIMQNILGQIDRAVASASTAQSMLRNAIQVPITTASNIAGGLMGQVSTSVVNDISRSVGNIVELQNVGMPGLQSLVALQQIPSAVDPIRDAAHKLAADSGITEEQALVIVNAWEPAHLYGYLGIVQPIPIPYAASIPAIGASAPTLQSVVFPQTPATNIAAAFANVNPQNLAPNALGTKQGAIEWCAAVKAANPPNYEVACVPPLDQSFVGAWWLQESSGMLKVIQVFRSSSGPSIGAVYGRVLPDGTVTQGSAPDPRTYGLDGGWVLLGAGAGGGGVSAFPPVPAPPPSPIPLPAPGEPLPPLPVRPGPPQQCIPICGLPPRAPEDCDPCKKCSGILYFNKRDCTLKVFQEGCGPPRNEDWWIELGSTTDVDELQRLIERYNCGVTEDNPPIDPGLPPLPVRPVAALIQLCNFLPPAATITRFTLPRILELAIWAVELEIMRVTPPDILPYALFIFTALRKIFGGFNDLLEGWLNDVLTDLGRASGCDDTRVIMLYAAVAVIGFADKWVSTGLMDLALPYLQQARFACPTQIPSPNEATAAVLADTMGMDEWRCIIRGNNLRDDSYLKVADAMRRKLEPLQLILLRARGIISDVDYDKKMRQLGYTEPTDRALCWDASKWLPGPTDIVRMMVRDTVDPNIVGRFGLDDDFDAKYSGQLKEFAKGQRVDDDVMRLYWRAHWNIPSPTQLFEFYQRFRSQPELFPSGKPLEDVTQALEQQDILPKWIPAYLAATFRPLTRIDAKRSLELGTITEDQAVKAWGQLGYSDENAEKLVKLAVTNAKRTSVKHPAVKRLAKGELSEDQAKRIWQMEGVPERYYDDMVDRAGIEGNANRRKVCIASLKKRYFLGEFDETQVSSQLVGLGISALTAIEISAGFTCELRSRGRQIAAKELVGWYLDSVISPAELQLRLLRLGYDNDDVVLILRQADLTRQRKQTAKEKRELAENTAADRRKESDRRRDEADQRRKDHESAALIRSIQRQLNKSQATREGRQSDINKMYTASESKLGIDPVTAVQVTDQIFANLIASASYTQNEIISAMQEALKLDTSTDWGLWLNNINALLASRVHTLPIQRLPQL